MNNIEKVTAVKYAYKYFNFELIRWLRFSEQ